MKIPPFSSFLLIFTLAVAFQCDMVEAHVTQLVETRARTSKAESIIKVYFVNGMFSAEQRKALWEAMDDWKSTRKMAGEEIRFVDLGETSGLIDCQDCLTVVRQQIYTRNPKWRSSFNRLRQDHSGRLISAWIGLDATISTTAGLRDLMLKALERGLGAA